MASGGRACERRQGARASRATCARHQPKGGFWLAGFAEALKLWETNIRLFTAAGGKAPEGDAQRIAFIKLLPPSVAAHVTLYSDGFPDYAPLKRFALRYIKINMGLEAQRASSRPVKLFDFEDYARPEQQQERESESDVDAFEEGLIL